MGCKKDRTKDDPSPGNNTEKYALKLDVTAFTQELEPMDRKTGTSGDAKINGDSTNDAINYLVYKVYEGTTGNLLKTIFQRRGSGGTFGEITDSLLTGFYTFAIAGAKDSIIPFNPQEPGFRGTKIKGFDLVPAGSEMYYKRMQLNVSGPVTEAVVLERVASKVVVEVTDRIPGSAAFFGYNVYIAPDYYAQYPAFLEYYTGTVSDGIGNISSIYPPQTMPVPDSAKGRTNYRFEFALMNSGTQKVEIAFGVGDGNKHSLGSKSVRGVVLEKNKKTVLKGALFPPAGKNTVISADPNWKPDSIVVTF